MTDIWKWSAVDTAMEIAKAAVSARDVAEAHLARLDEVNPDLNAVTNGVREEALAEPATWRDEEPVVCSPH
jgi:amidase